MPHGGGPGLEQHVHGGRGEVGSTTRRADRAIWSKAARKAPAGAVHTRNTVSITSRHLLRDSGSVRSPRTTSTPDGRPAASGLRVIARTRPSVSSSWDTTWRPIVPVAPVTRIRVMGTILQVEAGAWARGPARAPTVPGEARSPSRGKMPPQYSSRYRSCPQRFPVALKDPDRCHGSRARTQG